MHVHVHVHVDVRACACLAMKLRKVGATAARWLVVAGLACWTCTERVGHTA